MRHDDDVRESEKARKLFDIAYYSVSEIVKVSGILSQKGLCEAVLFNSNIILNDVTFKGKPYYDAVSECYLYMLFALIETQRRDLDENELRTFVNERIKSYSEEYDKLTTDGQYVPIWMYSAFYLAPLEGEAKPNLDILQVMSFQIGLIRMATKVRELLVKNANMDFRE